MRNIVCTLLLASFVISIQAQERNEIGFSLGTTYYMGDYNPNTHFYQPSPAGGILFRRNMSDFYSIRLSALYGFIKGSHNPKNFYLPGETPAFSKSILEVEAVIEIGFLPFNTEISRYRKFTPYALTGIGVANISGDFISHIPIGIGIKYSPVNRWTIGLEWRLHKTFNDNIDGYANVTDSPRSIIHNNDWFAYAGFLVSFRLVNKGALCPAYE
ncbi:MAG: DUF6089 family protein [Bacteroidales bacterium]|nr:DUF6089 family protein [Bacteroidales bacterium]